jgi:hypothetical protein
MFVIDGKIEENVDKQQSNDEDKDVKFLLDQFETLIQSNWKCQIPN